MSFTAQLGEQTRALHVTLIPHVLYCCRKSAIEHQMQINSHLKIVPNRHAIYNCLSNIS